MNAEMIDRVGIRVDVTALHEEAWDKTVAVVAHDDAVRLTRLYGFLGVLGTGAVARGLYTRDDERLGADIAEHEGKTHGVALGVRTEVVLLARQELNARIGCFLLLLSSAGGSKQEHRTHGSCQRQPTPLPHRRLQPRRQLRPPRCRASCAGHCAYR